MLAEILLEQSLDAVSIVGPAYRYRYVNPTYERLTGIPLARITGAHVAEIMGAEGFADEVKPHLDRALAGQPVRYQAWFNMVGGSHCMDVQYTPLRREDGSVDAVAVVARDITQFKLAEEAASRAEQRLRLALEAARAGTWETELRTGYAAWSDEACRIFGFEPGHHIPSNETWLKAVHPEDRDRVRHESHRALAAGTDAKLEYRVVWPNGEVRWVLSLARGVTDTKGRLAGMTGIVLDITERKRDEQALLDAKHEAELANRAKSSFLAAASHDLRQPFQAMRLFHQVLEMQADDALRPVVDNLGRAMDSGEELLNTLLDISTLDAGRIEPKIEPTPIAPLLDEVAADCASVAKAADLTLRVVPCSATVVSDRVLLKRMIRNLLVNSIRYTRHGGILLGCRRHGGLLSVQVADTGIGIPPDRQHMIFEDFYQINNAARDKGHGLGLGLAIVNRLGRLLGHPIRVNSREGSGSVFSIEVPQATLPPR